MARAAHDSYLARLMLALADATASDVDDDSGGGDSGEVVGGRGRRITEGRWEHHYCPYPKGKGEKGKGKGMYEPATNGKGKDPVKGMDTNIAPPDTATSEGKGHDKGKDEPATNAIAAQGTSSNDDWGERWPGATGEDIERLPGANDDTQAASDSGDDYGMKLHMLF
jgi:hypothetical protein